MWYNSIIWTYLRDTYAALYVEILRRVAMQVDASGRYEVAVHAQLHLFLEVISL